MERLEAAAAATLGTLIIRTADNRNSDSGVKLLQAKAQRVHPYILRGRHWRNIRAEQVDNPRET